MQHRVSSFLVLTVAASAAVALATWYLASSPARGPAAGAVVPVPAPAPRDAVATTPVSNAADVPAAPAATVSQLIADATGGDAAKRATAIAALSAAPRAEAVPVLRRILTAGEPEVDRTLALRALRDLALNQGDADGAAREAVRNALYHGDDFTKTDEIQAVLDTIEQSVRR